MEQKKPDLSMHCLVIMLFPVQSFRHTFFQSHSQHCEFPNYRLEWKRNYDLFSATALSYWMLQYYAGHNMATNKFWFLEAYRKKQWFFFSLYITFIFLLKVSCVQTTFLLFIYVSRVLVELSLKVLFSTFSTVSSKLSD